MSGMKFYDRYGPTALIIGASEGIGAAFARELAAQGLDLMVVARREEKLRAFAAEIARRFGVSCRPIAADMSTEKGLLAVEAAIAGDETGAPKDGAASPGAPKGGGRTLDGADDRGGPGGPTAPDIGLLVYNAAVAPTGAFLDETVERIDATVAVNCRGAARVARAVGERMRERGAGGIVLMSSLTGLFGSPYLSTYTASKAFLVGMGESLEAELAPDGISVVVTCAGPTATPGFLQERPDGAGRGIMTMTPEAVARGTLRRLPRGGRYVPGVVNTASAALLSMLPRRVTARLLRAATGKTIEIPTNRR